MGFLGPYEVVIMTIIGINLTRINAERKEAPKEKVTINNNISIKNLEKKDLAVGTAKQDAIRFMFEFKSKYEPKFAEIGIDGDVLFLSTAAEVKRLVEGWKKEKKVPKEIMEQIMNAALNKCNIEAIIISQQVNLPPPVQLPKLEIKQQ